MVFQVSISDEDLERIADEFQALPAEVAKASVTAERRTSLFMRTEFIKALRARGIRFPRNRVVRDRQIGRLWIGRNPIPADYIRGAVQDGPEGLHVNGQFIPRSFRFPGTGVSFRRTNQVDRTVGFYVDGRGRIRRISNSPIERLLADVSDTVQQEARNIRAAARGVFFDRFRAALRMRVRGRVR